MSRHRGVSTLQAEPAMVRAVTVALVLAGSLGFTWAADVNADTVTALAIALGFLVPLVQGVWTRYAVTANAKVVARVSTSTGTVVAGDAAVAPTGTELAVRDNPGDLQAPAVLPVQVKPELLA